MVVQGNTTDVQMFLLRKQTKQRQRVCQNKSWGPSGPLISTDDVTKCSIQPIGVHVVLNLSHVSGVVMCVRVCWMPLLFWSVDVGLCG